MTRYYRSLIQVEVLSDRPWAEGALEDLPRVDYAITDGDCSGQVVVLVANEEVDRERMATLLERQGSDPSFLIHDHDEDEVHADLWAVHYEIREERDAALPGSTRAPVARGLVEVDGPDEAAAHRHAKGWVSLHDSRFRRGEHYVRILRAVPAREVS